MTVPRFWREIPQRYNLQASRCGYCTLVHYPPRTVCPTCRRLSIGKMESAHLSGKGRILEATLVHRPAHGYERQVPYVLALVETDEGPVLTGQVTDCGSAPPVGTRVRAVFRKLGEDGAAGVIHYGTKWVLEERSAAGPQGTGAGEEE